MKASGTREPIDAAIRLRALDPELSFCVTAPAGSGKTELLSQRVLGLLARAAQPEEILAITFTRKAAAEMQQRIVEALRFAAGHGEPEETHKRLTWRLARAALQRDADQQWGLLQNPTRLRIQTIDGLCASLVRQLPLVSNFGGLPRFSEEPARCYQAAVSALLAQLEQGGKVADTLARLLEHLDNDTARLQRMLTPLLAQRDQWLQHLGTGISAGDIKRVRRHLEATLETVLSEGLKRVRRALGCYRSELVQLLDFAACRLAEENPDAPLAIFQGCIDLPGTAAVDRDAWLRIADWLLTTKNELRKSVTKVQGFPPAQGADKVRNDQRKNEMVKLLQQLARDEEACEALVDLRALPAAQYSDRQWLMLAELTALLPVAVAHLRLVFQQRGEVDYTEVLLSALNALGSDDAPGELLLRLDASIRHILVDEFQDTSLSQFKLLKRLVEGWSEQNADHSTARTLFLVGDGMQSIYGFRAANVGIFLEARHRGVNGVLVEDLALQVNFRSTPAIVDWVNHTFEQAFPQQEQIARGAVRYARSVAFKPGAANSEVTLFGLRGDSDGRLEAAHCVALVQRALREGEGEIAILVRNRGHLAQIVPALAAAGIDWRATEIDPLQQRTPIRDLLILLKALTNPADRISWLALLRSPLVGLDNSDLHALAAGADGCGVRCTVWSRLNDAAVIATLSPDARLRLSYVTEVLQQARSGRQRKPLRIWLEGCWRALGGELTLTDSADADDVGVFLDLLEQLPEQGAAEQIERRLATLYARPRGSANARVVLMTIHKSKGLEFDTVIIPGLDRGSRRDDRPLLQWGEHLAADGRSGLLLALKESFGGDVDPVYRHLDSERKRKQRLEETRLLYVAATRAVRRLWLLFRDPDGSSLEKGESWKPGHGSLLARIWRTAREEVVWLDAETPPSAAETDVPLQSAELQRIPLVFWQHRRRPADTNTAPARTPEDAGTKPDETDEASATDDQRIDTLETRIGNALHGLLEQLGRHGCGGWLKSDAHQRQCLVELQLRSHGVTEPDLDAAITLLVGAIDNMLADTRGRWLLNPKHRESVCEWELSSIDDHGTERRLVVDRSFIDEEGTRWIIDYKSSRPRNDETLAQFVAREVVRYRDQLEQYRMLVAQLAPVSQQESHPIRLALYFPCVPHWHELEPTP
jgi:ATP-dependent exoDNAse (exonuclease V) beta subunit